MGFFQNGKLDKPKQQQKLGGTRAAMFVYAMVALENMAFISNAVSLVVYFIGYMNFELPKAANTLTNFLGTAFLLALVGGFISDTFLTRFHTCVVFGFIEFLGYVLLTIQAHFQSLRPVPCNGVLTSGCEPAEGREAAILHAGLYLVALGTGGIKAALPALGADQFDPNDPDELPLLSSFFNWFLFAFTFGASFGVTFLVWISTNRGWDWGFGVCAVSILVAIFFVSMGRSSYRTNVPGGSSITRILQVIVTTARNWRLPVPAASDGLHELTHDKESGAMISAETEFLPHTDQFRFLDRAAIPSASPTPWRTCTVTQVEETKILLRMIPIILSTVFMNVCLAQLQTFSIQQATTMDKKLTPGFHIPAASLAVIPLLFMVLLVPVYDRVFVPLARKLTGMPTGIRPLQRIGVGLVLSAISMAVAGIVETRRKSVAAHHDMIDAVDPLPVTVFWLGFQYGIFGMADMFTLTGLLEFFYAESSKGMKSLSTAISMCSVAFGYFGSSAMVDVVNRASGGWLAGNNLNRDRLEYFYWLLAGLSVVNFGVYLACASWYRYKNISAEEKKIEGLVVKIPLATNYDKSVV